MKKTVGGTYMLEKMSDFFEARLDGYDEHMLNEIESAKEFYPFTASLLPTKDGVRVLDLGCGTGIELEYYFSNNPQACVTGIDLSRGMLDALKAKFPDKEINLRCDSYFDASLGESVFDAAVSVESLHHFTKEEKIPLYAKLKRSLTPDGYFVLTDYFAPTEKEEYLYRENLLSIKREEEITDDAFYHYDTPLTVAHEIEALLAAGFSSVAVLGHWGATYTLRAGKNPAVLNITNGDVFNGHLLAQIGEASIPFRESMMDGNAIGDIYSDAFVRHRAETLGVTPEEYREKACVFRTLAQDADRYCELRLWFGMDTFCQMNLLTLLAYLEQIGYKGRVLLGYIDDETFDVIENNIPVELGIYEKLYADVLNAKNRPTCVGVLNLHALDLYFDYHSDDGKLARLARENATLDENSLICLLLEASAEYGLSDLQAMHLIQKHKT